MILAKKITSGEEVHKMICEVARDRFSNDYSMVYGERFTTIKHRNRPAFYINETTIVVSKKDSTDNLYDAEMLLATCKRLGIEALIYRD